MLVSPCASQDVCSVCDHSRCYVQPLMMCSPRRASFPAPLSAVLGTPIAPCGLAVVYGFACSCALAASQPCHAPVSASALPPAKCCSGRAPSTTPPALASRHADRIRRPCQDQRRQSGPPLSPAQRRQEVTSQRGGGGGWISCPFMTERGCFAAHAGSPSTRHGFMSTDYSGGCGQRGQGGAEGGGARG